MSIRFVAIDFETANRDPSSVCAVGLAVVRDGGIVDTIHHLVRPPTREFNPWFVDMHRICWADVRRAPDFRDVWAEIAPLLRDEVLVAHNAGFDRNVLTSCLRAFRLRNPGNDFVCTVRLARRVLEIRPANLPHVCRVLGIRLKHHHAESDAKAAAQIALLAAEKAGVRGIRRLLKLCEA